MGVRAIPKVTCQITSSAPIDLPLLIQYVPCEIAAFSSRMVVVDRPREVQCVRVGLESVCLHDEDELEARLWREHSILVCPRGGQGS